MDFSLTAVILSIPLNKDYLWNSHCLWASSDSLYFQFKPTICTQSHPRNRTIRTTPLHERHFPPPLCHAKTTAVLLTLSNVTFAEFFTSTAKMQCW